MSKTRKSRRTAAMVLAACAFAAPAWAAKPPPPPPPPPPDPAEVCTPYGSYLYDVDCCPIYPQLCEGQAPEEQPVIRLDERTAEASGR
jgi:hypothetical protein